MPIKIPPVSRMDPIRASTQNLIIDAVNRFNAMSIVPPGGSQTFKNHAQGIILPARMDSDATDKQYASGDVVVITDYMDSLDGTVIGGVSRNYGVFVAKKLAGTQVGRGIAIVVDPIGEKSTGSVCVSGACLAKVNRVSTSPVPGEGYTQVTGSITPGETFLSIGKGTGDVDIIWEENEDVEEHWAYVILPCGSQSGIPAINKSGMIIPPNSAMQVQARDAEGLLEMIKPTADSLNQVYLSPAYPIPVNSKFYAIKPEDGEVALGSTPTSIGDVMGTVASSWEMAPNKTGFLYLGESGGLAYLRPFKAKELFSTLTTTAMPTLTYDFGEEGYGKYTPWLEFEESIDVSDFFRPLGATSESQIFITIYPVYQDGSVVRAGRFSRAIAIKENPYLLSGLMDTGIELRSVGRGADWDLYDYTQRYLQFANIRTGIPDTSIGDSIVFGSNTWIGQSPGLGDELDAIRFFMFRSDSVSNYVKAIFSTAPQENLRVRVTMEFLNPILE
jgi:hypothetical protein